MPMHDCFIELVGNHRKLGFASLIHTLIDSSSYPLLLSSYLKNELFKDEYFIVINLYKS